MLLSPVSPASTKTAETVPAPPAPLQSYSQALDDAEVSIDRLSKAMEVAEDEMEAAFRRTGDLHQSNAAKREMEVQELRRVLTAKEQSIDSLRESLSTTKRTLEARLHQTEAALAARHSEVEQLHAEVMTLHAGRKQLEYQLQQGQEDWAERQQQAEAREAEVAASVEELTVQARHAQAAVRKEREVQAGLKKVVEDLQQQVQSLASQLQQEVQARLDLQRQHEEEMHGSSRAGARKKEAVLKELRSQLKAERVHRRTSEQWLKSELRSREEMEALFVAAKQLLRSTAGEGAASAAQRHDNLAKAHRLLGEVPVAGIRAGNPLASSAESDVGELKDLMRQVHSTNVELVEGLRSEFGASRSLLEKDNQRLQRELQTLRQSLSQQLAALTSVEPER
ncbi:hypothetical protein WJX72_008297 [[Myrmecia] bisecta]|uniref:Uncharacterized protein n=1 Tax=[Myrmecia] bisecta TaxID=41462 RepID=A0AAW1PU72_9CHLO